MKSLWNYIEDKNWKAENKYKAAFFIMGSVFAFIGLFIWLIVSRWVLDSPAWAACFMGYPAMLSLFFGFVYAADNQFHDGNRDGLRIS